MSRITDFLQRLVYRDSKSYFFSYDFCPTFTKRTFRRQRLRKSWQNSRIRLSTEIDRMDQSYHNLLLKEIIRSWNNESFVCLVCEVYQGYFLIETRITVQNDWILLDNQLFLQRIPSLKLKSFVFFCPTEKKTYNRKMNLYYSTRQYQNFDLFSIVIIL